MPYRAIPSRLRGELRRAIQRLIQDPLALKLLEGDYVPFYRDEESFSNSGGADNILRSLQVQKEKRMHGSKLPVHNIVDNMARWTQLAVSRGIRNAQAIRMVDFAKNEMPEGFVKLVGGASDSTARILRDGRYEYYEFEDPLFADAFKGLEQFGVQWPKFAEIGRAHV